MNWQKAFTRNLITLIITIACAPLASGQTPPPDQPSNQRPNQPMNAPPSTLSPQMPDHLAWIEPDKVTRWTLKDAILAALEKNVDIEITRQNTRFVQFDLGGA